MRSFKNYVFWFSLILLIPSCVTTGNVKEYPHSLSVSYSVSKKLVLRIMVKNNANTAITIMKGSLKESLNRYLFLRERKEVDLPMISDGNSYGLSTEEIPPSRSIIREINLPSIFPNLNEELTKGALLVLWEGRVMLADPLIKYGNPQTEDVIISGRFILSSPGFE